MVTVTWSPVFGIPFKLEEIDLMIRCAELHYDRTCRMAATTLMDGWRRTVSNGFSVTATFRELDLALKCLETGRLMFEKKSVSAAQQLSKTIKLALQSVSGGASDPLNEAIGAAITRGIVAEEKAGPLLGLLIDALGEGQGTVSWLSKVRPIFYEHCFCFLTTEELERVARFIAATGGTMLDGDSVQAVVGEDGLAWALALDEKIAARKK